MDLHRGNISYPVVLHEQRLIVGSMFVVISVAGIVGNLVVIFSVFASKKLQTFTNMFIVNLSVADLLSCLMMQLQCVVMFSPDDEYPLSIMACKWVAQLLCTACGCSLYTLASIGLYRLLLLKDASRKRADRLQKKSYAIVWIGLTWIIPLLVNVVTNAFANEQFGYNEKYHVCGAQSDDIRSHEIELAQVFGLYGVAFVIIMISYSMIYINIYRHTTKTLREMDTESHHSSILKPGRSWRRTASTTSTSSENARQLHRRQITITKNTSYVVLAFLICITPYTICLLFPHLNGLLYSGVLFMLNSCVNPVLYGFKHPHFRKVFKPLLTCRWSKVPQQSELFKKLNNLRISNFYMY